MTTQDETGLRAALHAAIDDCDEVGWGEARTTDLRPADVHVAIDAALAANPAPTGPLCERARAFTLDYWRQRALAAEAAARLSEGTERDV